MNNTILIQFLKGIKVLEFKIPQKGVHVLTACNGSGKTTLLACIERVQKTNALNKYFIQQDSWNVDSFDHARITYKSKMGNSVSYRYQENSNTWRPTKQNTTALSEFGYSDIVTMPTLGTRVFTQKRKIRGGSVRAAKDSIREAMAEVLENDDFKGLLRFKTNKSRGKHSRARQNNAYLLPRGYTRKYGKRYQTYFSESNFSLGEIFILNLLFELDVIKKKSLLVIDELEVALHPKVQINLLEYIDKIADEKELTVIISTHSSSLIKYAKNLIFLEKAESGEINTFYNCSPNYALQEVSISEEIQPDYVFFVEDTKAELLLKEIIRFYFKICSNKTNPLCKILPIGGYGEVLRFTKKVNRYVFHEKIGQYAVLDGDVKDIYNDISRKGNSRTVQENELFNLFKELDNKTIYLEITPELGLWKWINDNIPNVNSEIQNTFFDSNINIRDIIRIVNQEVPTASQNPRKDAKTRIDLLLTKMSEQASVDKFRILNRLVSIYVNSHYSIDQNKHKLQECYGRVFN